MAVLHWVNEHFNLLKNVTTLGRMSDEPKWEPCSSVKANASLDDLILLFSEAKDRLKEVIIDSQRYVQKSTILVSACITILTGLFAFLGTEVSAFINHRDEITNARILVFISGLAVSVLLCIICVVLKDSLRGAKYSGDGTRPRNIYKEKFIMSEVGDLNRKALYNALLIDYEQRVKEGLEHNRERARRINESITYLYAIPVATFAVWFLGLLFRMV